MIVWDPVLGPICKQSITLLFLRQQGRWILLNKYKLRVGEGMASGSSSLGEDDDNHASFIHRQRHLRHRFEHFDFVNECICPNNRMRSELLLFSFYS